MANRIRNDLLALLLFLAGHRCAVAAYVGASGVIDATTYGAVASSTSTTASATAGSANVTESALGDFKTAQKVVLLGTGASCNVETPVISSVVPYTANSSSGAPQTTSWSVRMYAVGANNCWSAPSAPVSVNNGWPSLDGQHWFTTSWSAVPRADHYVIMACSGLS